VKLTTNFRTEKNLRIPLLTYSFSIARSLIKAKEQFFIFLLSLCIGPQKNKNCR